MAARFLVAGGTGNWNSTTNWSATSGGASGASFPVAGDDVTLDAASGAASLTVNVASACANFNATGFTGTFAGASTVTTTGNWTWGAGMNRTYTGQISFTATAARTITSNGKSFGGLIVFNGVAGVWQLSDAFTCTTTVTLTRGTWDCNGMAVSVGGFVSSSGFTRVLALGNSLFEVTTSTGFTVGTPTGQTITTGGSSKIKFSGVTGATSFAAQSFTYDDVEFSAGNSTLTMGQGHFRDLLVTNPGTGTLIMGGTPFFRHMNFTGFAGTWGPGGAPHLTGDYTLDATMTLLYAGAVSFDGTAGVQNVTTNGVSGTYSITFNNLGASFKINGNLTAFGLMTHVGGASGPLDASGIIWIANRFTFSGSSGGGTGNIDLTGSTLTAMNDSNAYILSGPCTFTGSELITSNSSAVAKTFSIAGGLTGFNKVTCIGTGTGSFTQTGTFSIDIWTLSPGSHNSPSNVTVREPVLVGTAGLPITIGGPFVPNAILSGAEGKGGVVACDYLDISACHVAGGARWFAGRHANDNGLNLGWIFADAAPRPITA